MKKTTINKVVSLLITVSVFSIAMGFLESAVVIYLRKILYPAGFDFPLVPISPDLILTEVLREFATLIMLAGIGILAGRNSATRFAWFLYSFAIWDIFYYVFLWFLIGWPESLMTWDVLFLIPVTWTGPVLTPLILTLLMIAFTLIIVFSDARGYPVRLTRGEWALLVSGSIISIFAFTTDYSRYVLHGLQINSNGNGGIAGRVKDIASTYTPGHFPWLLFITGALIITGAIILYARRIHKEEFRNSPEKNC